LDALVAIDSDNGFDSLVDVVDSEGRSVRDADSIFLLVDRAGAFRAGNVRDIAEFDGWRLLERAALPGIEEKGAHQDRFFATWDDVSKGKLLVGFSDREVRETQLLLLHALGWGLGLTAILAAVFGTYLTRRAQRRIGALADTLTAVSQGAVGSRVPLTGSGDDMDRIGEQINHTLGHLQRLIENVNQASSDIAHDLKKPVGRLRQRLDQVQRTATSASDYREAVDAALRELDCITEAFEALLRIAQIEAGARKARFARVDLRGVIRDVADVYEAVVEDAGDALVLVDELSGPAMIRGDRELLTQLFANLIENAVRHCPPSTRIGLGIEERDRSYAVTLSDTGPGIPLEERENVFRRLYRLERARSTPGSGLGLSLVAAIAELHDATVSLGDNAPGLRVETEFLKP
jgi:signal transduction histidine kinase